MQARTGMNIRTYTSTHTLLLKNIIFAVLNFKRCGRATFFFLAAGGSSDFSAPFFFWVFFFHIGLTHISKGGEN